jgi:hypothetical protein
VDETPVNVRSPLAEFEARWADRWHEDLAAGIFFDERSQVAQPPTAQPKRTPAQKVIRAVRRMLRNELPETVEALVDQALTARRRHRA